MNNNIPVNASCNFEEVNELDFIDVIRASNLDTIRTFPRIANVYIEPTGDGFEIQLEWAISEIYNAFESEKKRLDFRKNTTQAVLNARRALNCIVDWFLKRDGFLYCKDYKDNSKDKSKILLEMGIIDTLTSKVIQRFIDKRNFAEHQYTSITSLSEAEDVVEITRRLLDSLNQRYRPFELCLIMGYFPFSFRRNSIESEFECSFYGWTSNCLIRQIPFGEPWYGIAIPDSSEKATIRRLNLKNCTVSNLIKINKEINELSTKSNTFSQNSDNYLRENSIAILNIAKLAGIV